VRAFIKDLELMADAQPPLSASADHLVATMAGRSNRAIFAVEVEEAVERRISTERSSNSRSY